MKSKNLKEFPNSQIHEATLHRHPTRLLLHSLCDRLFGVPWHRRCYWVRHRGAVRCLRLYLGPIRCAKGRSDVLTNGFVGRKKRSDIAATPPFLSAKSSKLQFILHFSLFTLHLRQRRNLPFFPSVGSLDDFAVHFFSFRLGFIKIMTHIRLGFIRNGHNIPLDFVKQSNMLESNDKNDGGAIRKISIIPLYALSNLYNRSED